MFCGSDYTQADPNPNITDNKMEKSVIYHLKNKSFKRILKKNELGNVTMHIKVGY